MSGPVTTADAPDSPIADLPHPVGVELVAGRRATVGAIGVRRLLPQRARRLVGPWCFADHMGPGQVTEDSGVDVGPHPHAGLQTVTWLLAGEVLHRDSLASEQTIRPGQLNLMTAGHGVAHSEETTGAYRGAVHGVQLWLAQPEKTRNGPAAFEHHPELPALDTGAARATVLVGQFADATSPARRDTEHVGLDLDFRAGQAVLPLDQGFEHALAVLDGRVRLGTAILEPGTLAYLGIGRSELAVEADGPAHGLLLGGAPFPEPVLMWWNYVGRGREELLAAHRSWTDDDGRFGRVRSPLPRLTAPPPPWAVRRAV